MAKTYRPYVPEQDLLLPPSLRDWLPEGHLAYFVNDLVDQANTPALFLSGKGDIARDFTPSSMEPTIPGTVALKLVPRRSEPEYEFLVVALDPATFQIRALTTRDHQGGESTLTFSNMKENRNLSDKDFVFSVPRGVTVVADAAR